MSQYYGTLKGTRGAVSRQGHKSSGLKTVAASWSGAVVVRLHYNDVTEDDEFRVDLDSWHGDGQYQAIASGAFLHG